MRMRKESTDLIRIALLRIETELRDNRSDWVVTKNSNSGLWEAIPREEMHDFHSWTMCCGNKKAAMRRLLALNNSNSITVTAAQLLAVKA
ncbi:MAG: hypothetical protein EBY29_14165 [Planctomycetes bacterium]|nr:hypothetical protein [Planctomycetota bacterium]